MTGTSRSQNPVRASRGRWKPGAGRGPNILPEPPAESGRREWPRRLVGPAGRARYSACVTGDRDATERTGPARFRTSRVVPRGPHMQAPVPTVERRSALGREHFCEEVSTMKFDKVSPQVDFPRLEEEILDLWKKTNAFERSVHGRPEDRPFVFYEGPPTANGRPGFHHALARGFKDLIPRYKTMQ